MKKEEKSTPLSAKARSIYKYELQATNQILKDTLDIYPSSLHSTPPTNRHSIPQLQYYLTYHRDENHYKHCLSPKTPRNHTHKIRKIHLSEEQDKLNSTYNKFQDQQHIPYLLSNHPYNKLKTSNPRQIPHHDIDSLYNSQIYSFSSENQDHFPKTILPDPSHPNQNSSKKEKGEESKKELKRQRRGLAHISLKVKNIVAKKGKMTFKEVSDEVLKETQEDLPNDHDEREKEMKNIRRRVYDALNVLVSVGILGKDQRFVVHTDQTSVPGKKLSSHWQLITQKKRLVQQQQKDYENKRLNLIKLKKNYQNILLLQQRNRSYLQTIDKKSLNSPNKKYQLSIEPPNERLYFPLIFIILPKIHIAKVKVQIQYEDRHQESIKKFIIEGTQNFITDLDSLKHIRFNNVLSQKQITTISKQLKCLPSRQQEINFLPRMNPFINQDDIYLDD